MTDPSTEAALRDINRSIGGLESTVNSMLETWRSQEANASQGRRDLHQKFDAIRIEVATLSANVTGAVADISELKPAVDAFKDARQQAVGAQKLGRWIWAALFASGGIVSWAIANWITIGPKPPLH